MNSNIGWSAKYESPLVKAGWPNHNFILWDCMTMEKGSFPFPEQTWVAYLWRGKVVHWVGNSDVLRIQGDLCCRSRGGLLQWMEHAKVTTAAAGNGYLIGRKCSSTPGCCKEKNKTKTLQNCNKAERNHGIATARAAVYWVFALLYTHYFI